MFISLKGPPFLPLKANSIGSITKQSLQNLGVDTTVWKAHSTRGAGVAMYKSLGFSSEDVCELGKWKNVTAFTSHYLRLNATDKVGSQISDMVHRVSPLSSADSDLTWTKGIPDHGGGVREDEAQSNGEPTLPPLLSMCKTLCPPNLLLKFLEFLMPKMWLPPAQATCVYPRLWQPTAQGHQYQGQSPSP